MPCGGCGDNCNCSASQCCQSCKCDQSCTCSCKRATTTTDPAKTTKK